LSEEKRAILPCKHFCKQLGPKIRYREPLVLFKKNLSSGNRVYYYIVWDDLGRRRQFSTGERTKALAQKICLELYRKNRLIPIGPRVLQDFAENWLDFPQIPRHLLNSGV